MLNSVVVVLHNIFSIERHRTVPVRYLRAIRNNFLEEKILLEKCEDLLHKVHSIWCESCGG